MTCRGRARGDLPVLWALTAPGAAQKMRLCVFGQGVDDPFTLDVANDIKIMDIKPGLQAEGVAIPRANMVLCTCLFGTGAAREPYAGERLDAMALVSTLDPPHAIFVVDSRPSGPPPDNSLVATGAPGGGSHGTAALGSGSALAAAGGGGGARPAPAARALTEVAGPAFEGEAREVLRAIMPQLCPWATDITDLVSRTLDLEVEEQSGEADIFCYLRETSAASLESVPERGLRVVEPGTGAAASAPPAAALDLPAGQRFSPFARQDGPLKYFLAEATCALEHRGRFNKLAQLDGLMEFIKQRWMDRTGREVTDITSIIGAAGLVFTAGEMKGDRKSILDKCCQMVRRDGGPNITRLVQAGRFFVMVLDKSQTPVTFIARETEKMRQRMERMAEDVAAHVVRLLRGAR